MFSIANPLGMNWPARYRKTLNADTTAFSFVAEGTGQGPTILAEVEVRASDVSTAVREAARTPWPPRAIGFRLVDLDGREVLGRQQGDRRTQ